MGIDLHDSRILITGGHGFLGQHLVEELNDIGVTPILPYRGDEAGRVDLCRIDHCENAFDNAGPIDYVFHLAGYNGGIAFNAAAGFDIFADNTVMAINVLRVAAERRVKKVVSVVASCAYPQNQWEQDTENDTDGVYHYTCEPREVMMEYGFFDGPPHRSVACHGYAKRNLQLASSLASEQYNLDAVCVCPTTLYGPGDDFDPARSKIMGAMVKRFVDAADNGDREVTCWGTGKPLREFLYVKDAAKLLLQALDHYEINDYPLNLGSGDEVSVLTLAAMVADRAGYDGKILWDASKPDGQGRKRLNLSRMKAWLPGVKLTALENGIEETIAHYRAAKLAARTSGRIVFDPFV